MPNADFLPLYIPVLKWKQGEHLAVKPLASTQKARVQPLVEIPDRPYDWKGERYTKSWDKHIDDVVAATATNWGTAYELAVDQIIQDADSLASNAATPWEYLFKSLWAAGVKAVPVVSRRASASEVAALIQASKTHRRSRWLLRYALDTYGELPSVSNVQTWFKNSLVALAARHSQVDAVLDLGYVGEFDPKSLAAGSAQLLQAIATLGPWRQVALVSGGFPKNLAGVQKGTKQIPRRDWELFKRVIVRPELGDVNVAYGDYGIAHVEVFDEDPRKMVMSANIRYTHWNEWFVFKSKNVRDYGYGQYKDLCKLLVALPVFMGAPFSHGDTNYDIVATNLKAGPGNATQWRRDATNHHIHVVLHQLANQPEF